MNAVYNWIVKRISRNGKMYNWRYRVRTDPKADRILRLTKGLPVRPAFSEAGVGGAGQRIFDAVKARYSSLSKLERQALHDYVTGPYEAIKLFRRGILFRKAAFDEAMPVLRWNEQRWKEITKRAGKTLDSARKKLTFNNPTDEGPLYRGLSVNRKTLEALLTKDRFSFSSDTNSTTYNPQIASRFTRRREEGDSKVVFEIHKLKKASSAMYEGNPHIAEREMLVGKAKFRITNREFQPDTRTYVISLEEA